MSLNTLEHKIQQINIKNYDSYNKRRSMPTRRRTHVNPIKLNILEERLAKIAKIVHMIKSRNMFLLQATMHEIDYEK